MTDLSNAVCSITSTQRRRYFWAAWWTGAPQYGPFRKPDASNGGAKTPAEALAEAQRISGRHLTVIDAHWARAWNRVLRGEPAPRPPERRETKPEREGPREPQTPRSAWSVLGLEPGATLTDVKRAFRKRALETHPDQGGDSDAFREARRAYEHLVAKFGRPARRSAE